MRNFALLPLALTAASLSAAIPVSIPLANASFEGKTLAPGSYEANDIEGWIRDGGSRNLVGVQSISAVVFPLPTSTSPLPAPAEGPQFGFINSTVDGGEVAIQQVVGALLPHTFYTFTVAVGNRLDKNYANLVTLELRNGSALPGELLAASTNAEAPPEGAFADHSVSFLTPAEVTGDLIISIRNTSKQQINVDNVRLTSEDRTPPPPPPPAPVVVAAAPVVTPPAQAPAAQTVSPASSTPPPSSSPTSKRIRTPAHGRPGA